MVATTYVVKPNGKKLLDEYRGDRTFGDCFIILKNGLEKYEVVVSTLGDQCNCLGWINHGKCKHIQMVYEQVQIVA
jgi:hypothetical protein